MKNSFYKWQGVFFITAIGIMPAAWSATNDSDHSGDSKAATAVAQADIPVFDRSAFRLLGTAQFGDARQGSAVVIEDVATGKRRLCAIGEPLYGGVLRSIERGRVAVETPAGMQHLELPEGKVVNLPSPEASPNAVKNTQSSGISSKIRLKHLLKASGLRPVQRQDRIYGLLFYQNAKALKRMGLKRGDVIVAIDEQGVDANQTAAELETLLSRPAKTLEIIRGGNRQTIAISTGLNAATPMKGKP